MVSHPQDAELINVKDFSALIGSMSYVTHSIPIVATALSYSGARQSRPLHRDYRYLLHTLGYLRDHADEGLTLMTVAHLNKPLRLYIHVDASYLGHSVLDSTAHHGFYFAFNTFGSFHCRSLKQRLVVTSSNQAEAKALQGCIVELFYITHLCSDLFIQLEPESIIYEDNLVLIDLTTDGAAEKHSRHYLSTLRFIQQYISSKDIKLIHIDSNFNPADALAKPTFGSDFLYKSQRILGVANDTTALIPAPLPSRSNALRPY
jgi:hypothetical protein